MTKAALRRKEKQELEQYMANNPIAESKKTWIVKDWAGNYPFGRRTFHSFEDAWGFIREFLENESEMEIDLDEYFVDEVTS